MLGSGSRIIAAAGAAAIISAMSCSSTGPCMGVNVGDRFTVTVVDTYDEVNTRYDAGAPNVCGFGFDVSKGQVLVVTDAANIDDKVDNCNVAGARFEPFNGWTWTLDASRSVGTSTNLLVGTYEATNGTCSGTTVVSISVDQGTDSFAPYVPGQAPHVIMARSFYGSGTGCPTSCNGYFIVNVRRA